MVPRGELCQVSRVISIVTSNQAGQSSCIHRPDTPSRRDPFPTTPSPDNPRKPSLILATTPTGTKPTSCRYFLRLGSEKRGSPQPDGLREGQSTHPHAPSLSSESWLTSITETLRLFSPYLGPQLITKTPSEDRFREIRQMARGGHNIGAKARDECHIACQAPAAGSVARRASYEGGYIREYLSRREAGTRVP